MRALTAIGVGETQVLINVMDANDHSPVFPRDKHETQITEEDDRHLPKAVLQVCLHSSESEGKSTHNK